jgi:archaellum component FlaC
MSGKVHVLPDENLGGGPNGQILREYVEVDRKAKKGDKIVGKNTENIYEVDHVFVDVVSTKDKKYVHHYDYKVLEPTDIVRLREENGTERRGGKPSRFRLVDRKAKVGEKVIVFGHSNENGNGVFTVYDVYVVNDAISYVGKDGKYYGASSKNYRVLEPVEPTQTAEPDPIEVDTRHANPQVVDMLANLAQRVTELERKLGEYARKIDGIEVDIQNINVDLGAVEENVRRLTGEIDSLHANQRKLAEDTTNRLDRHSERIRELAEMKPYFKTFKPEIHFHKTPEDLAERILKALEEAGKR